MLRSGSCAPAVCQEFYRMAVSATSSPIQWVTYSSYESLMMQTLIIVLLADFRRINQSWVRYPQAPGHSSKVTYKTRAACRAYFIPSMLSPICVQSLVVKKLQFTSHKDFSYRTIIGFWGIPVDATGLGWVGSVSGPPSHDGGTPHTRMWEMTMMLQRGS